MTKVAIYGRISTEKQESDNQLYQLKNFAKKMNWNVVKVFEDKGISGKAENMPAFNQMIESARKKEFDILLVWSIDRLSRKGIGSMFNILSKLNSLGIKWHSYTEDFLSTASNEAISELLLAIFSWIAEQERKKISERTKASLFRLKALGIKLGRPKTVNGNEVVQYVSDYTIRNKKKPSLRETAKALGISPTSVYNVLKCSKKASPNNDRIGSI